MACKLNMRMLTPISSRDAIHVDSCAPRPNYSLTKFMRKINGKNDWTRHQTWNTRLSGFCYCCCYCLWCVCVVFCSRTYADCVYCIAPHRTAPCRTHDIIYRECEYVARKRRFKTVYFYSVYCYFKCAC